MAIRKKRFPVKGFTLMETMIALVIFSVATTILFNFMNGFMKVYNKQDIKSSTNIKFTKVFKSINNDLSLTSTDYFDFYDEADVDPNYKKNRWFLYASAQNQGTLKTNNQGALQWNKVTMYYLIVPENDTCKDYDCCPHKILIKNDYLLSNFSQNSLNSTINTIIDKLKDFIFQPKTTTYPELKHASLQSSTKICEDITDLTIKYSRGYCSFELSSLREHEAKKELPIGTINLNTDARASKYIERIGWTTVNKNI